MQSAVARRYGRALYEVAHKAGKTETVYEQLRDVAQTLEENAPLYKLLKSPVMTVKKKQELVQQIWQNRLEPEVAQFLNLVIQKQREAYLGAMFTVYEQLFDQAAGKVEVDVTSAVELQDDMKRQIAQKLEEWLGKQVRLNISVKPELLAGLRIQVGDLRIDGSLNARLQKLYAAIKGTDTSSKGVTFS